MASASSSSRGDGDAKPDASATKLLDEVRRLGHYPKDTKNKPSERKLCRTLQRALKAELFSPAQLQELEQLKAGAPQLGDDRGSSNDQSGDRHALLVIPHERILQFVQLPDGNRTAEMRVCDREIYLLRGGFSDEELQRWYRDMCNHVETTIDAMGLTIVMNEAEWPEIERYIPGQIGDAPILRRLSTEHYQHLVRALQSEYGDAS